MIKFHMRLVNLFLFIAGLCIPGISNSADVLETVFFQPSRITSDYSSSEFKNEFELMNQIGIRKIIIQWAASGEKAYYPSKLLKPSKPSLIENILNFAGQYQMEVFIGLPMPEDWFIAKRSTLFYDKLISRIRSYTEELNNLYGNRHVIKGWYIPYEFPVGAINDDLLLQFLTKLSKDLKQITGGGTIIIAPYMGKTLWSSDEIPKWEKFLSEVNVDIIAIQDGVGAYGNDPASIADYFRHVLPLFESKKKILWADVEAFDNNYSSATTDRFIKQINLEGPSVEGIAVFDFSHYLNPQRGEKASLLYQGYKEYLSHKTP